METTLNVAWLLGLLFLTATVLTPLGYMVLRNKATVLDGWKRL